MPIPPLDERGLLPPGCHPATAADIVAAFCTNAHREQLWLSVAGFLPLLAVAAPLPSPRPPLVLGGSFFSDKPDPADIEATLILPQTTPGADCWLWLLAYQTNHDAWKQSHGVDFYPTLPGSNDFAAFFGYVGPKTAEAKGLAARDLRGTLRLDPW